MKNQLGSALPTPTKQFHQVGPLFWIALGLAVIAIIGVSAYYIMRGTKNSNTTASVSANTNASVNQTNSQNINLGSLKTYTYQDDTRGFSFIAPEDWQQLPLSSSIGEGELLDITKTVGQQSVNISISYFLNDDPSLEVWVDKHRAELKKIDNGTTKGGTYVGGQEAFSFTVRLSGLAGELVHQYIYIGDDSTVYEIRMGGHAAIFTDYTAVFDNVRSSFAIIGPRKGGNPDQVTVADWQTITFQKADHGFTLSLPAAWNMSGYGWGFRERDGLIHSYINEGEKKFLSFSTTFYNNSDKVLSEWVDEHKQEIANTKHIPTDSLLAEEMKQDNGSVIIVTMNESAAAKSQYHKYCYMMKDGKVYEMVFSGDPEYAEKNTDIMSHVFESLTFIDPKPLLSIIDPNTKTKVGEAEGYNLDIDWLDTPAPLNITDTVVQTAGTEIIGRDYYQVGNVTNGRYAGKSLLMVMQWCGDCMMASANIYRVIFDQEASTFVYLEKESDSLAEFKTPFTYDATSIINGLSTPTEIDIPNSQVSLTEELFTTNQSFLTMTNLTKVFDDPTVGGVYYQSKLHCFLIKTPDGLVKMYHLKFPFAENFSERERMSASSTFIPEVMWYDTTPNTEEYTSNEPTGGCGSGECHSVYTEEELGSADQLAVTGETNTGDTVYEYRDSNNTQLKEVYDSYWVDSSEKKPSYDAFVKAHPVFFWRDPFGHWVRFRKTSYLPAVECGKPVIYLYPQQDIKVNVQVAPTGGFSITEPIYPDGGWNVIASPSGLLTNIDGTIYPYLFWEGVGLNYAMPERGFMVAQSEVVSFLGETLISLGLNERESAEFMDFWVPKMQGKPYYFITFLDQQYFDQLAPLTVTPKPDSVIRVFMDYKPLDNPISVEPQKIVTPQRHGFTVVEWGGALHK